MKNEAQEITKLFLTLFNVKVDGKGFLMQMGIAKKLLKEEKFDDLVKLLTFIRNNIGSMEIYSLNYVVFIKDKYKQKMIIEEKKLEEEKKIRESSLKEIDNKVISNNKKLFKNNIFGRN